MIKLLIRIRNGVMSRIRIAFCAVKYLFCRLIPLLDRKENWVICERGTDARDNGYVFYRYMVEHHPEIRIHYLITPDSADYAKVADHAVVYGSMKNYWVVAKADKIISTHCYTALPVKAEKLWRKLRLANRFYFLQHGITQGKTSYLFGDTTGMRLFCCGANPEFEYIRKYFRHPEGVVQCTGLARYDHLVPGSEKRQILVMPTWRLYLRGEEAFRSSEYLRAWNALLRDPRLINFLADTEMKLVFYPHYEIQTYLKYFMPGSSDIILADFEHYDVQQLLKESMMLITDYSSVHFDFAYMNKPCLYYQFDSEQYHRKHYKEGYYHFETDGFGAVETEHDRLIDEILALAQSNFMVEDEYRRRTEHFFAYQDQSNCQRIYQAITNA